MSEALLLVSFGSTYERPQASFRNIEKNIRRAFPDREIVWAYTSSIVRKRMLERGVQLATPLEAIEQLYDAGFRSVAVQSLHIIPGLEYEKIVQMAQDCASKYPDLQIRLGAPLLDSDEDMRQVAQCLYNRFSSVLADGQGLLFMGHGSAHQANDRYQRIDALMKELHPELHVAAVEGTPSLEELMPQLKQTAPKGLTLMPLMSVAGDHASNDMAGDDDDSWKSILSAAGFEVSIDMTALGDMDDVCSVWAEHLRDAKRYDPS